MGKDYPTDWSSRRKKVLRRDHHQCQRCGVRGGDHQTTELHVHHIKPKSEGGSHRLRNLKTVCKSCHQEIHGHGVGGRPSSSSSTSSSNQELSPEEMVVGLVGISLLVVLILTGFAITQVMPEGQEVTQSYELDYHLVNDEESDMRYSLYNGPPLYLEHTIHDNAISTNGETEITFLIVNPADHHLQGRITVNRRVGWRGDEKTLATIDYDMPPDTSDENTMVVKGNDLYDAGNSLPASSQISIENEIYSEDYYALAADQQGVGNDEITVRKPLFDRFGFKWLCFIGSVVVVGVALHLRRSS